MSKTILIFFGPPGSGKGTQVDMLAEKLKLPVIAPGELLRQEIERKTKVGRIAKKKLDRGKLVDDKLIEEIISKSLADKKINKGAIFDGYPRRKSQLNYLIKRFKRIIDKDDKVFAVLIDVRDKEVKARFSGRRACDCGAIYHLKYNPPKVKGKCDLCGKKLYIRSDDKPEIIARRLKLYHKEIKSILDYWLKTSKLIGVNGEQSIKDVEREIRLKLKERGVLVT